MMTMFWCTATLFVLSILSGLMVFAGNEPARSVAEVLFGTFLFLTLVSAFFEYRKYRKLHGQPITRPR